MKICVRSDFKLSLVRLTNGSVIGMPSLHPRAVLAFFKSVFMDSFRFDSVLINSYSAPRVSPPAEAASPPEATLLLAAGVGGGSAAGATASATVWKPAQISATWSALPAASSFDHRLAAASADAELQAFDTSATTFHAMSFCSSFQVNH